MSGMKQRTIRKILKSKLDDWVSSITDQSVAELVLRDAIVTGGSIASMLLGEKINDYDVYFKTIGTVEAVARYYINQFVALKQDSAVTTVLPELQVTEDRVRIRIQSAGVAAVEQKKDYRYFEMDDPQGSDAEEFFDGLIDADTNEDAATKYRPVFMSENAITLSNKVQIVVRFFGTPEELHKNYDFIHCCNWYDYQKHHLELNRDALASLLSKTLYYQGSLYPMCSVFRCRKFIERGWHISAGELLKMVFQISKLDLNDFQVFKEQLTGVDAAYFYEVLQIVEAAKAEGKNVDATYLATIVDRVFNL